MSIQTRNLEELTRLLNPDGNVLIHARDPITKKDHHILLGDISGTSYETWDPEESYDIGERSTWNYKLWESKVDANVGNIPVEGDDWTEVSASSFNLIEFEGDLNTLREGAEYYCHLNCTNAPLNEQGGYLKVMALNTFSAAQLYISARDNTYYYRRLQDAGWYSWNKLVSTDDLPEWKKVAKVSTTAALPSYEVVTINGVENCLRATAVGLFPSSIDGITVGANDSILVRHENNNQLCKVYELTSVGSNALPPFWDGSRWVLTPRQDMRYSALGDQYVNGIVKVSRGQRFGGKIFAHQLDASTGSSGFWAEYPHTLPSRFQSEPSPLVVVGDVVKHDFTKVSSAADTPMGIVVQTYSSGNYYQVQSSGEVFDMSITGSPVIGDTIYVSASGGLTTTETDWVFGIWRGSNTIQVDIYRNKKDHFRGEYASLVALEAALPTANPGDYAIVNGGVSVDAVKYIWDDEDVQWIIASGAPVANASESLAGIVEEGTDAEVAAGTVTGITGAKLFVSAQKLITWWTAIKAAAQTISGLWNFTTSPTVPTVSAGDSSTKAASTAFATTADNLKANLAANVSLEKLTDASDVKGLLLLSRLGALERAIGMEWDDTLKQLRFSGSTALLRAGAAVTDGNFGLEAINGATEAFKEYDSTGNYRSVGVDSDGKRVNRFSKPLRLKSGANFIEIFFISQQCEASVTTDLLTIATEDDQLLSIEISCITCFNADLDYIIGKSFHSFKNAAGVVTNVSQDSLRYTDQYSSIKSPDGVVTNTDTRIDCAISGENVKIQFVNTVAKATRVRFEYKYILTPLPV